MRWLLLAVCLVGCAKVADPDFPTPLVSILAEPDGVSVVAPEYRMHFRSGNYDTPDLHMPDSLLVNGTEVFASETNCGNEGNAGIALFPTFSTNTFDGSGIGVEEGSINLFGGGPFIAKINVHYALRYTCNGSRLLIGDSNFTFFPHGKITRHDSVNPVDSGSISNPDACKCPDTQFTVNNFFYTSFWSFVGTGTDTVTANAANDMPIATDTNGPFPAGTCTTYANQRGIAVRFTDGQQRIGATRVLQHGGVQSHVFDIQNAATIQARPAEMPDQIFSAIQIVNSPTPPPCSMLAGALSEVPIRVNDDEIFSFANEDGIYDLGFHDGSFDISVVDEEAPPDTAVIVQMPSGNFDVSQDPEPEHPPLVQREGTESNRYIIIFPDGLTRNSTVNVEPK